MLMNVDDDKWGICLNSHNYRPRWLKFRNFWTWYFLSQNWKKIPFQVWKIEIIWADLHSCKPGFFFRNIGDSEKGGLFSDLLVKSSLLQMLPSILFKVEKSLFSVFGQKLCALVGSDKHTRLHRSVKVHNIWRKLSVQINLHLQTAPRFYDTVIWFFFSEDLFFLSILNICPHPLFLG